MGVTILAVLQALIGVGALLVGLMYLSIGGIAGAAFDRSFGNLGGILAALGATLSIIFIVVGLGSFLIAWGFLAGKPWARILGMIFAALDMIYGLLSLPSGALTLIVGVAIVYYLKRPDVKTFFGKSSTSTYRPQ